MSQDENDETEEDSQVGRKPELKKELPSPNALKMTDKVFPEVRVMCLIVLSFALLTYLKM